MRRIFRRACPWSIHGRNERRLNEASVKVFGSVPTLWRFRVTIGLRIAPGRWREVAYALAIPGSEFCTAEMGRTQRFLFSSSLLKISEPLRSPNLCGVALDMLIPSRPPSNLERIFSMNSTLVIISIDQPTLPSISRSMRRFNSTLYSIGNSFTRSLMKPFTLRLIASASVRPRCMR